MLFVVVERFKNGDPGPVYRRFREQGRLMGPGVEYVGSWVAEDLTHCYQVMECADRGALDSWIDVWSDLVDFQIIPAITSAEASARVP